jgi:putative nucleotidyltransferase with HDIG domain
MIGISNARMQHSLAVARKMKKIAESMIPPLPKYKCEELFLLGYLHDIGYEFTNNQDEHAHVGGEILSRQEYKYWKEVYYHGDPNAEYWSDALVLLNIADLTIDHNGKEVDIKERLDGIAKRYGKGSKQVLDAEALVNYSALEEPSILQFLS